MPPRSSHSNQAFPLSSNSRARRRVAMIASAAEAPCTEDSPPELKSNKLSKRKRPANLGLLSEIDEPPNPDARVRLNTQSAALHVVSETAGHAATLDPVVGKRAGFRSIRSMLEGSQPVTWVFTGDSITHGGEYTQGERNYSEHFAERVRWELRRPDDVIINTAVIGEKSDRLMANIEARVLRFQPDVVSVMVGLIDALSGKAGRTRFRRNLETIVKRLDENGSVVLLQTPPRFKLKRLKSHSDMQAYIKVIRETSRDLDVACIDHWDYWKRAKTIHRTQQNLHAADGVHPNALGQRAIARLIFRRLGIYDPSSFTCTSHVF